MSWVHIVSGLYQFLIKNHQRDADKYDHHNDQYFMLGIVLRIHGFPYLSLTQHGKVTWLLTFQIEFYSIKWRVSLLKGVYNELFNTDSRFSCFGKCRLCR